MYRAYTAIILFLFYLGLSSLKAQDTLLVDHSHNSGLVTQLRMPKAHTVFEFSRLCGTNLLQIQELNPILNLSQVRQGQYISLPVSSEKITPSPDDLIAPIPVFYRVKSGETLYRIARIYADNDVAELMELNKKAQYDVSVGEYLQLGWINWPIRVHEAEDASDDMSNEPTLVDRHTSPEVDTILKSTAEPDSQEPEAAKPVRITRRGIALWEDSKYPTTQLLALHPTAQVNSEIVLYNPMMKTRVKAKVVSTLPQNSYPNNISVVISPSVAEALGALDHRFLVEMTYLE